MFVLTGIEAENYYLWLCDMIKVVDRNTKYTLLLKELHSKKFLWSVPNDDNRIFEAMSLREKFCYEEDIPYKVLTSSSVSMMELIVALSIRCHWMLMDGPNNMSVGEWFWKLLENLGLDKFTDEDFYDHGGASKIEQILNRVIERTYDRYGNGGLFPLKKSKKDQRKVEIWYQMCQFLMENYYVEDVAM